MTNEELVKQEFENATARYNGLWYDITTEWYAGISIGSGTLKEDAWRSAKESVVNMQKYKTETLK